MADRLEKLVAKAAGVSRKEAGALIKSGRVRLDGITITRPDYPCQNGAALALDGKILGERLGPHYLMLNKPAGVVCATRDPRDRTVLDLLPPALKKAGLFPAGRLDKDTTGFVLLTDDGPFAHFLLAPRRKVPKTYRARLDGPIDIAQAAQVFSRPMDLGGGEVTSPARLSLLEGGQQPLAELVIFEGMFHQVKRMFAQVGRKVTALERVAIGAVPLDRALAPGEYRPLTDSELALLKKEQPMR